MANKTFFFHITGVHNERGITLAGIATDQETMHFGIAVKSPVEKNFIKREGRTRAELRATYSPYFVDKFEKGKASDCFYNEVESLRKAFLSSWDDYDKFSAFLKSYKIYRKKNKEKRNVVQVNS